MGINVYCVLYEIKEDGNIIEHSLTKVLSSEAKAKAEVKNLITKMKTKYNIKDSSVKNNLVCLYDYAEQMGRADYEIIIQIKKLELE